VKRPAPAALIVGIGFGFVAAVHLVRTFRILPLVDSDPAWIVPRLTLGLATIAGAALAAGAGAGAFFLWASRARAATGPTEALSLSRAACRRIAFAALAAGALLRFTALDRLPPSLWIDDLSLIAPALALSGAPRDFANSIRPSPFGVAKPYGTVGVLYLEAYRASLRAFGVTVFGVRFLSAAAGVCSIVTVFFLGRILLPAGGGALAALALAGLRWNLLLSRWGWNAIVLAPFLDAAAIVLLFARRRRSALLAAAAGALAGISAHLYLAAWVAAAGLLLLAAWPIAPPAGSGGSSRSARPAARLVSAFAAAFALFAAPLFLFKEGRVAPYFARASDHNVIREMQWAHSPMRGLSAAADSLAAPWFKPDPSLQHDLPGRTRLGWLLGIPVALALARAVARPGEELSAYLLTSAAAALAASVAGGDAGVPNGYRFGYLADVTAVAASAGFLLLAGLAGAPWRRAAALAAVGILAISGTLAVRDALLDWPERRETFDGFHGQDTLIARAALRWERYGPVSVEPGRTHSAITVNAVRRYRLDPGAPVPAAGAPRLTARVASPGAQPLSGERAVERVRDAWGRDWGVVMASRAAG
jgi:hypothetical protein